MPEQIADHLGKSLADLIAESQALRGDVHNAEQARRRAATINLAMLALLVAFVIAVLAVGWQNNRLSHQVKETNTRVADCTTPGGGCYDEGAARTGAAVGNLIRAEVAVAECARLYPGESGPGFDAKIEACVADRLTRPAAPSPKPTPKPTALPSAVPTR